VAPVRNVVSFAVADTFLPDDEAIRSAETSLLTRAKRRHITEDGILYISTLDENKRNSNCCFLV
jgi:hypothetical protein